MMTNMLPYMNNNDTKTSIGSKLECISQFDSHLPLMLSNTSLQSGDDQPAGSFDLTTEQISQDDSSTKMDLFSNGAHTLPSNNSINKNGNILFFAFFKAMLIKNICF